jgi:hypothetical protein
MRRATVVHAGPRADAPGFPGFLGGTGLLRASPALETARTAGRGAGTRQGAPVSGCAASHPSS